jgi:hypothetical protein
MATLCTLIGAPLQPTKKMIAINAVPRARNMPE